jgi:hypothetical protein
MTSSLSSALKQFSLDLTEQDFVKTRGGISTFELEVPDDDDEIIGSYLITANEEHSLVVIELSFSFQDVEDYLEDVKDWIFDVNQKIKIGSFKLDSNMNYLIYTHSIYTKGVEEVPPELIMNMFNVADGMCQAYRGCPVFCVNVG